MISLDVSIKVTNVSKAFSLDNNPFSILMNQFCTIPRAQNFDALKNICFQVEKGETVGVIGHNGSGKSTLLQIIAGVLVPTSGVAKVEGRIASMLELGTGLNPDFTGKENILFNGRIHGLSNSEIMEKFDSIVEFSEIGDFLEMPVKTYSSGMMLRLAFSVLINMQPDVLIIDEALAVGDCAFQHKCFGRLRQLQESGVTILFVSHSSSSVIELCERVILLDQGELILEGNPKDVVNYYQKLIFMNPGIKRDNFRESLMKYGCAYENNYLKMGKDYCSNTSNEEICEGNYDNSIKNDAAVWYESNGAKISNVRILTDFGKKVNVLYTGHNYVVCYDVEFFKDAYEISFGTLFKTISGFEIAGANTLNSSDRIESVSRGRKMSIRFKFRCVLRNGTYFLNCGCTGLVGEKNVFLHRGVDALMFRVISESRYGYDYGIVDILPEFCCNSY